MSRRPSPRAFLFVLIAAIVLATGANLAAQGAPAPGKGKPVLAGKVTKSGGLTTLQRTTNGPALRLRTKAGSPPLSVNSNKKVAKLNADSVDGRHVGSLETKTFFYRLPSGGTAATSQNAVFPDLPQGTYLVSYAVTFQATAAITTAQCFINETNAPFVIGLSYAATKGNFATANGTGAVDGSGGTIQLRCSASTQFVFDATDAGGVVTFTRTKLLERSATAPAPRPTSPSKGGGATASGR